MFLQCHSSTRGAVAVDGALASPGGRVGSGRVDLVVGADSGTPARPASVARRACPAALEGIPRTLVMRFADGSACPRSLSYQLMAIASRRPARAGHARHAVAVGSMHFCSECPCRSLRSYREVAPSRGAETEPNAEPSGWLAGRGAGRRCSAAPKWSRAPPDRGPRRAGTSSDGFRAGRESRRRRRPPTRQTGGRVLGLVVSWASGADPRPLSWLGPLGADTC